MIRVAPETDETSGCAPASNGNNKHEGDGKHEGGKGDEQGGRQSHHHKPHHGAISDAVVSVIGEENRESSAMCTFDIATSALSVPAHVVVEVFKTAGHATVTFTNVKNGESYKAAISGAQTVNDIVGAIPYTSCAQAAAGVGPRLLNRYWDNVAKIIPPS